MKVKLLSLLVAMFLIPMVAPQVSAGTGPITLELTDTNAPDHVLVHAGDLFKELVEKRSGGEILIERYRSGELYNPRAEIEALEVGSIAMAIAHVAFVGGHSPALEFISSFGAQGIWDDKEHYYNFIDNPKVREIAAREFEAKLNSKLLGMLSYGTSVFVTRERPVRTVEDFKGQRARAAGTAQAVMYRALGTSPVDLSIGEVYMALERGTIEAFCTGPCRTYLGGFYEVAPHVTQDGTSPELIFWLAINLDKWNQLTAEQQQLLEEVAWEVELFSRKRALADEEKYYKLLAEVGSEVIFLPEEERARIREIVEPVMKDLFFERADQATAEKLWSLMEAARAG